MQNESECHVCSFITTRAKPPYCARVIDMMLQYVPPSYWRDLLSDPRGGFAGQRGLSTKIDDLRMFTQKVASSVGDMPQVKAAPVGEASIAKVSKKLSSHGSTENNGVSLQKHRSTPTVQAEEPKKSERSKESKDSKESKESEGSDNKSASSRGSIRKTSSIEAPKASLGDVGDAASEGSRGSSSGNGQPSSARSSGGGGLLSSAFRRDSITSASLVRKQTPSNGTRSTLFTTPPSVTHTHTPESRESTVSRQSRRFSIHTPTGQKTPKIKKKKKQRKSRSKTRKPRGRSASRKRQKESRSGSRKKKSRGRSPRRKKEVGKHRGKKHSKKRPRSKTKRRGKSRRRHHGKAMHNVHIMAF